MIKAKVNEEFSGVIEVRHYYVLAAMDKGEDILIEYKDISFLIPFKNLDRGMFDRDRKFHARGKDLSPYYMVLYNPDHAHVSSKETIH